MSLSVDFSDCVPECIRDFSPEIGLVIGSGLRGVLAGAQIAATLPYAYIPGLPVSRVPGHEGAFLLSQIGGRRLLVASGRVHLYEGWNAQEVTAGVRFMAAAGIHTLLLTNAAGSLNRYFAPGDWMMLSDHINLQGESPLTGAQFLDLSEAYCGELRRHFAECARSCGIVLHNGIYAAVRGPQYETPAEVRMLARMGADAVGMSTVLETIQARALGIRVAGFSCLTNFAAGLHGGILDHTEVTNTGLHSAGAFAKLLAAALPTL
jgi:purine-nucleoside phosphorylase